MDAFEIAQTESFMRQLNRCNGIQEDALGRKEDTMKNKKLLAKIIFVIILVLIIVYTFRDSADDIIAQLAQTSLSVIAAITAATVLYHLAEAWITYGLARRYKPGFKYRDAVYCAFNCSFYRLSTLGSGAGVAAIVYLGKKGVGYSEATGLYTTQYMVHKVSIALFSGIFFVANWSMMSENYRDYGVYLILAYLLTALISLGLVLFAVSAKFHRILLALVRHFNKNGRLTPMLRKLEQSCAIMEKSTGELLKDAGTLVGMVLKNMLKLFFWYCIPFLILFGSGEIALLDSLSVTSLSVMTAAVIPTPAGIGSTELIMTSLFGVLVDLHKAAAITLLYRVASFIVPFLIGGALILISKARRALTR